MLASINAKLSILNNLLKVIWYWIDMVLFIWILEVYVESVRMRRRSFSNGSFWNLQNSDVFVDLVIFRLVERCQSSVVIFLPQIAKQFFILSSIFEIDPLFKLQVLREQQFFGWCIPVSAFQSILQSSEVLYSLLPSRNELFFSLDLSFFFVLGLVSLSVNFIYQQIIVFYL